MVEYQMPVFAPRRSRWMLTKPGPYHIEHHGIAWMICDATNYNCAGVRDRRSRYSGAVLMRSLADAEAILLRLTADPPNALIR